MTTESRTHDAVLALFEVTPEQILAKKRTQIKAEIKQLENSEPLFWRLVRWRQESNINPRYSYYSLLNRTLQLITIFFSLLFEIDGMNKLFWFSMEVMAMFSCFHALTNYLFFRKDRSYSFRNHLLHYLILPLMPALRLFDLLTTVLPPQTSKLGQLTSRAIQTRENQLAQKNRELASLSPATALPEYYETGIAALRTELLGDNAELRIAEIDLAKRLEVCRTHRDRLGIRINQALGDELRIAPLLDALHEIEEREKNLYNALRRVQDTISKTSAVLDECLARVRQALSPLQDLELLKEIQETAESDERAMAASYQTINTHLDLVRDRLFSLAAAVTSPLTLPAAESSDLDAYFAQVESVAEQVSDIEAAAVSME